MKFTYYVNNYLDEIVSNEYYILIIIEDLIRYFKFKIVYDTLLNDIRTIKMHNDINDNIVINSQIISYMNEQFTQFNNVSFIANNSCKKIWKFYGKYYQVKKLD